MRKARIYYQSSFAGLLSEEDDCYRFVYDDEYLRQPDVKPISLTLPVSQKPYESREEFLLVYATGWALATDSSLRFAGGTARHAVRQGRASIDTQRKEK